ncbi:hypothetical protein [Phycicoccus sp.]|uniref:hypothetical protein n=1 Tax=Phycicoccus sp. TaxID=1902410 RepID=UPI002C3B3C94|nr:hypothetical protein [Phycicoccus sp.]HMM93976.1 hypothetical protein [Phycicoccus sp.]
MTHPLLAQIPDRLLERRGTQHARALMRWLEAHNCRPTLADIEAERLRRATHTQEETP